MAETSPDQRVRDIADLLGFVHDRDVPCPMCRYNLRGLTRPLCPECRQPLTLTVGAANVRFGWLLVAIAPSIFSGIAALMLLIPIVASFFNPLMGNPPWWVFAADGFGLASGVAGVVLALHRHRFICLPRAAQMGLAFGTWIIHVSVFFGLLDVMIT